MRGAKDPGRGIFCGYYSGFQSCMIDVTLSKCQSRDPISNHYEVSCATDCFAFLRACGGEFGQAKNTVATPVRTTIICTVLALELALTTVVL
jgi:hypothetical protein